MDPTFYGRNRCDQATSSGTTPAMRDGSRWAAGRSRTNLAVIRFRRGFDRIPNQTESGLTYGPCLCRNCFKNANRRFNLKHPRRHSNSCSPTPSRTPSYSFFFSGRQRPRTVFTVSLCNIPPNSPLISNRFQLLHLQGVRPFHQGRHRFCSNPLSLPGTGRNPAYQLRVRSVDRHAATPSGEMSDRRAYALILTILLSGGSTRAPEL